MIRDDFEREYDNDAEHLVSGLEVHHEDDEVDAALKNSYVDMYRMRLRVSWGSINYVKRGCVWIRLECTQRRMNYCSRSLWHKQVMHLFQERIRRKRVARDFRLIENAVNTIQRKDQKKAADICKKRSTKDEKDWSVILALWRTFEWMSLIVWLICKKMKNDLFEEVIS